MTKTIGAVFNQHQAESKTAELIRNCSEEQAEEIIMAVFDELPFHLRKEYDDDAGRFFEAVEAAA